ncbi:sensor histidine kinase [Staphylococcus sp. ACRSN]|uniref:sensor histidine kinase n=1 Tax=Staphylococcus sp. ACRSN TaxID=2918214 RepID=UPI001EF169AB|nr:sensor histidine kinase [Staphylococcus sp. ACRSN]MCG7337782.1 sensor histidine kinase [Staphylococcus sp. ACRSN]
MNESNFDYTNESKLPVLTWILITYLGAIILQTIENPLIINSILFTILIFGIYLLYSSIYFFKKNIPYMYIIIMNILILVASMLMDEAMPAILIGLYSLLIGQSVSLYSEKWKIIIHLISSLFIICFMILITGNSHNLFMYLIILIPIMTSVLGFSFMFYKQVNAKLEIEHTLNEIELAYQQVEYLTLLNERQRLARDLHDTLAQGVAGYIMQLEALENYLNNNDIKKSKEIVKYSKSTARETLNEAREAIDNLRLQSSSTINYSQSLNDYIEHKISNENFEYKINIQDIDTISPFIFEHIKKIIGESIANIKKHAQAHCIKIDIQRNKSSEIWVRVEDDGVGFEVDSIKHLKNNYGLEGLKERVEILDGKINIFSTKGKGTIINVILPIKE